MSIETIAAKQGWTTETLLALILEFVEISGSGLNRAIVEFLQTRADEENEDK